MGVSSFMHDKFCVVQNNTKVIERCWSTPLAITPLCHLEYQWLAAASMTQQALSTETFHRWKVSAAAAIILRMFDRNPDASLVVDLVRVQDSPLVRDADLAAVELIEQLVAWNRVVAWAESQRLATMRRFCAARVNADEQWLPDPAVHTPSQIGAIRRLEADMIEQAGKFAAEEIALALNISPTMAAKQLTLASELATVHRDLGDALGLGQVSAFVASMVATATRQLPDNARQAVDAAVTADATQLPAGKAITAARNRVTELDGDVDARTRRAMQERRAFLKPLDDGVALVGAVLPADDAIRAFTRIDDLARTCKAAGDAQTLDQLRADLFANALATAELDTDRDSDGKQQQTRKPVTVQVTIALTSLLGLDSRCGRLDGYGAITPTTARHITAAGDTTLKRLLVDPVTGAVITADPTRYRPDAATQHAVRCRDWQCRLPVCTARVRDLDHKQAFADGGLTTSTDVQGLCERSHLAKSHPGWSVTGDTDTVTIWHTPTGREYPSLPPPATGYGTGPPGDRDKPLDLPSWATDQQQLRARLTTQQQRPRGDEDGQPGNDQADDAAA